MARIVELSQLPGNSHGECYTEEDKTNIHRLIAGHQTTVDDLDAELERLSRINARLSRINAELLQNRSKHFNLIQRGKSALSPHSKLPSEIIREIIWHASCSMITIPFDKWINSNTINTKGKIQPMQTILTQVCSAWRKVALSIPQLWTFFTITSDFERNDLALEMALELFSRSRGLPITLTTIYTELSPQAFQALIVPNQFSELKLTVSEEQLLQFYQFPTEACANLEVLSFHIYRYLDALGEMPVDFHPDKYPRLKSLTVRLTVWLGRGPAMRISVIPWRQLTALGLRPIYSSQLNTLRQCVFLKECDLGITWDFIDGVGEIHLPCLLRFCVTIYTSNPSLLRVFRFPNLEEFESSEDDQELMLEHFNLQRLRVLRLNWRKTLDFGALFKLTSSLESVSLPGPKDETHMHELATGSLGPSLHSIKASYYCTWEQALAFAETRWECVDANNASGSFQKIVPFKRIKFRTRGDPTDHQERLKALKKRGTVIEC